MGSYGSVVVKGATGLVLTVLLCLAFGWIAREQRTADVRGELILRAQEVARALDTGMLEQQQETERVAKNAIFQGRDADAQRRELEALQARYPHMAWIGLTDVAGTVVAATGRLLEGQDVSQRPWFGGARFATFTGDVHDAKLLAKHLTVNGGEPPRFIDIAVPVRSDQGQMLGVLGVHLNSRWLDAVAEPRLFRAGDVSAELSVLGADGSTLTSPLTAPDIQRDGATELVSHAITTSGLGDFRGFGWKVVAHASESALPSGLSQWQILVLAVGIGLTGFFASRDLRRAQARRLAQA